MIEKQESDPEWVTIDENQIWQIIADCEEAVRQGDPHGDAFDELRQGILELIDA